MFEAVIFDFGGVMTDSPFEAFNRLEAARGIPLDTIRHLNSQNPHENAWARFERSEISPAEFDSVFAAEAAVLGITLPGHDVLACLKGAVRPSMVHALRRISACLKTGCITNNVISASGESQWRDAKVDEAMSLFHHVIESSKLGIRKPDPRIYKMMLEELNVDPARSIYLDDLGINLKPARDLGMTTIKVGPADTALDTLEGLLNFSLR